MMRSLLEILDHNVDTLVSMAGVQMGVYGAGFLSNNSLFANKTLDAVTALMYTPVLQDEFSISNFWHAVIDDFLTDCVFLPVVNNLVSNTLAEQYKTNFMKTNRVVFLGSPDDGTVVPWESELFGFYNAAYDGTIPMQQQQVYVDDSFGLQSMDQQGRLIIQAVPGIQHSQWLHNETNFVQNVLPYLI
jgi:palmitoyl-protein thioesterase